MESKIAAQDEKLDHFAHGIRHFYILWKRLAESKIVKRQRERERDRWGVATKGLQHGQ